ncbi:MAG TPA: hypothetical protein VK907_11565 [Phnomibacter sp.]|nr:hypothetical protein [Phnomibacter sp.]
MKRINFLKKILFVFWVLAIGVHDVALAHIGSPGVVMQAMAGPYNMMVNVEPPDVIPGVAKVTVYVQGEHLNAVKARAIYYRTGDEGAPRPDELKPVPGQPGQFAGEVWMMVAGSSSVQLMLEGDKGTGELVVPVVAASTAVREMPKSTGYMLAGLGLLLVFLMMTIIGSSVSDGLTPKGETLSPKRVRNRRIGFTVGLLACAGILYGGNAWWQSWANNYNRFMFKPMQATSTVEEKDGTKFLRFTIDTADNQRRGSLSYVVPDHGKMMHMFLMRLPAMDAFAHLHPQRLDSTTYTSILPSLPKGRYLVFADIVYLSGYTETIKDTLVIEADVEDHNRRMDKDDAYAFALPANLVDATPPPGEEENFFICGKPGTGVKLKDGSSMVWEGQKDESMYAGQLYNLQFAVYAPDGSAATLDPYLGMAGHAAIVRNDGNVYIHMHPSGTANMAAVSVLRNRIADTTRLAIYPSDSKAFSDSVDAWMRYLHSLPDATRDSLLLTDMPFEHGTEMQMTMDGETHSNMLQFPYVFPAAGQYRIWVQVKRNGQVLTAAFDKWVE